MERGGAGDDEVEGEWQAGTSRMLSFGPQWKITAASGSTMGLMFDSEGYQSSGCGQSAVSVVKCTMQRLQIMALSDSNLCPLLDQSQVPHPQLSAMHLMAPTSPRPHGTSTSTVVIACKISRKHGRTFLPPSLQPALRMYIPSGLADFPPSAPW